VSVGKGTDGRADLAVFSMITTGVFIIFHIVPKLLIRPSYPSKTMRVTPVGYSQGLHPKNPLYSVIYKEIYTYSA
jgi:hypothetical protein